MPAEHGLCGAQLQEGLVQAFGDDAAAEEGGGLVPVVTGEHELHLVAALMGGEEHAVGVGLGPIDLLVGHDHLLHDDLGEPLPDAGHELLAAEEELVRVGLRLALNEVLVLGDGREVPVLVGLGGGRGLQARPGGGGDGLLVVPVLGHGALLSALDGGHSELLVEQGAKEAELASVHVELMGDGVGNVGLGLVGAGCLQGAHRALGRFLQRFDHGFLLLIVRRCSPGT